MSDKEAPVEKLSNLNRALSLYGYHLSTSGDIRYYPVDFGHYKMYRDVLIALSASTSLDLQAVCAVCNTHFKRVPSVLELKGEV